MPYYERLSALDASFLFLEDANNHMHVGGILLLDERPLRNERGGLDIARIRGTIATRLHRVPRFRQKLSEVPGERHPIWIDDDRFNLEYHVRHSALPRPGNEEMLKALIGRIMSQQLDRGKPLWEMWFVEGLEGDRVALITKTHHCMIDGVAGAELISVLLDPAENVAPIAPDDWKPRPAPSTARLLGDALLHRAAQPVQAFDALREAWDAPGRAGRAVRDALEGVAEVLSPALHSASETPLNRQLGPHRRYELIAHRVADYKRVKDLLGGTLNDVVLATVAGALRGFFQKRGLDVDRLEVRAMVPVSVRAKDGRAGLGNQISQMVAALPIHVAEPEERLANVRRVMAGLKESKQALGGRVLTGLGEWTVPNVLVQAVRMTVRSRPYNLVVTNVPGPQLPLYLLGSRMLASYPVAPLTPGQALNVALFSYDGGLYWGLNADWDALADLPVLAEEIRFAFGELQAAAEHLARSDADPERKPRRRGRIA
ncbi:diacylglycerol O-acyltransferase [Myxococcaceae bacterium]|jgi:WS/DGAT/MGAT family acyltransferase|nr:diacylglycerol O-acyltransferase [Myxococcaceae bacterium]